MKRFTLAVFFSMLMILFISSCRFEGIYNQIEKIDLNKLSDATNIKPEMNIQERRWTILVYMSADNNLEGAAIEDILEMEASNLNTEQVSVFILFDRSPSYDASNKNWSGTRLLRLRSNSNNPNEIQSEAIECRDLGLSSDSEIEIDMSSPYVLSTSLKYLIKRYPAENYGLIMWGHGTGWRNDSGFSSEEYCKGFAFDETSRTYMTLQQMGDAVKACTEECKLGFIGFDTCFGAELEVIYELKDYCDYFVGSEGLVLTSGWNYSKVLSGFQSSMNKTAHDFCNSVISNYSQDYVHTSGASICEIKMNSAADYFTAFDNFMKKTADYIDCASKRDQIMNILYSSAECKTKKYTYGTENNDVYLDVESMTKNLKEYFDRQQVDVQVEFEEFQAGKENAVIQRWTSEESGRAGGPAVFFSALGPGGLLSVTHPSKYIKGKTGNQGDFVSDSCGYVPTLSGKTSLLDKLFYTNF